MRLFVTFKETSDHKDKVMMFTGMTKNQVQDTMVTHYGNSWHRIYTEPEFSQILPNIYNCKEQWVQFGTKVKAMDSCGTKCITYPKEFTCEHETTLEPITKWFRIAKPNPNEKDASTQLGAMYEEVAESITALSNSIVRTNTEQEKVDLHTALTKANIALSELSAILYNDSGITLDKDSKVELLDALADITVTTTGSAYMYKFKWDEALTEVNKSNFSKFENNKPVLNTNGKIIKGKDYFKPNLTEFV